jgi:GNAT superfamily N-acetyltransferase
MALPKDIRIKTLTGEAITPYLPALARLRIEVFRDWPYLYDGEVNYEREYMRSYVASPRAAIIAALNNEDVVGVSTCLPLADETGNVKAPFIAHGLPAQNYFYFGESVLKREYRNQGIGVAFFAAREAHAKSFGDYTHTTFCAVRRPQDHPLRPANYVPLDAFWTRRGYSKQPGLYCTMRWLDLGEAEASEKTLDFWTRALA